MSESAAPPRPLSCASTGSEKRRSSPCVSRRSSSISARKNARNSAACTMVLTSRYAARSAAETAESVTLFVTPSMASSETPKRLSVSSASPERFAQLVGQQSAGAQVAVLRGQRVGRNVALKLLKHSLLHLGIDEVGDRLDEHCGEQRRADERDHHAHRAPSGCG